MLGSFEKPEILGVPMKAMDNLRGLWEEAKGKMEENGKILWQRKPSIFDKADVCSIFFLA